MGNFVGSEWAKLHETLRRLVFVNEGAFAFVTDIGGAVLCIAMAGVAPELDEVTRAIGATRAFHAREIAPRASEMRKARRFSVEQADGRFRYAASSFAGIYATGVWFAGEFDGARVRASLQRMLPRIEACTLELPPFDGPGSDEGGMRARA